MRKIKYRARTRLENGKTKWVQGFYYEVFKTPYILPESETCETAHIVDKETLGAFIQRTDKNGVDVYEGDIICYSFLDNNGEYLCDFFLVEFFDNQEEYSLGFRCKPLGNKQSFLDMFPQEDFAKYIRVRGNRYDDPRLLKKLEKRGRADE